jgi:hypothetical protein
MVFSAIGCSMFKVRENRLYIFLSIIINQQKLLVGVDGLGSVSKPLTEG